MIWKMLANVLRALPGEASHKVTVTALSKGIYPRYSPIQLPTEIGALRFPNPIGLAAGFDKNGEAVSGCFALGFGSVEIGTVTPLPQPGNPKPRVFRLPEDGAFINRYGFNSDGMEAVAARLSKWRKYNKTDQLIGVNIGANNITENKVEDYFAACFGLVGLADYLTINVSSPNTFGLRDLQKTSFLKQIIKSVKLASVEANLVKPIFIKLDPDLNKSDLFSAIEVMINEGIAGVIISNTTLSRDNLKNRKYIKQTGGLSGVPLFRLSSEKLSEAYIFAEGHISFIGVGGISSVKDAYTKILLGADILQLYSSLALKGPHIANHINTGLAKLCVGEGINNLKEVCGSFNSFFKAQRHAENSIKAHLNKFYH